MEDVTCPMCFRDFQSNLIDTHVQKCLFLHSHSSEKKSEKRGFKETPISPRQNCSKKIKLDAKENASIEPSNTTDQRSSECSGSNVPLAEKMRPDAIEDYVGQGHVLGQDKMLRQLLFKKDIPNMILWGPPGCGKTSLANIISNICKSENKLRFVKLSATMAGINDVKQIVKIASNESKYQRKTILFMDEIHRFNKLQQDVFLPHIENGTIVLIGATTENPSFSLNSALLSRCRVFVLEKLTVDDTMRILLKAAKSNNIFVIEDQSDKIPEGHIPRLLVDTKSLKWLAEICDGDARIALNSFQLAIQSKEQRESLEATLILLEDIKDGIKRSHILYDKKGEEHYNIISALHKSMRASDDNAALYWLSRMIQGGEDPLYIARRLIRCAGEDVGMADPNAINIAVSCMQGCQLMGMPECDVLLAECVVYLARAPKSTEVYKALLRCKKFIVEHKGPLPGVPLHLRNASTSLMSQLGYGQGYNTDQKEVSGLLYMPEGTENVDFFKEQ